MRILLLAALLATALPSAAQTVVLVRHAEKADDGTNDPPLTAYGSARAEAIAGILSPSGLTAAVTSPRRRTVDTAAPSVKKYGADAIVVGFDGGLEGHLQATVERIHGFGPEDVLLVVGHSNTIPALIGALGGPEMPNLNESEYDLLFFLSLNTETPELRKIYFRPVE
jgi:broad specificity phosphatase PhoE